MVLKLHAVNGTISTGIDGTTREVAQVGDLWIPRHDALVFENFEGKGGNAAGVSITTRHRDDSANVVMGDFQTPAQGGEFMPPMKSPLPLNHYERGAVISALVRMLGGSVTLNEADLALGRQSPPQMYAIQDPRMWKVEVE